jgi:hypothetical protein
VISRLRALFNKKQLTFESFDLNDATREVIALTLNDLQRQLVTVQSELADDLPSVTGDRIQLQQVILNLLRNGADAMAGVNGRPRRLVVRTARAGDEHVVLLVRDAGVGLDPTSVNRLFDAFFSTKSGGMGIGLSRAARSLSVITERFGPHRTRTSARPSLLRSPSCRPTTARRLHPWSAERWSARKARPATAALGLGLWHRPERSPVRCLEAKRHTPRRPSTLGPAADVIVTRSKPERSVQASRRTARSPFRMTRAAAHNLSSGSTPASSLTPPPGAVSPPSYRDPSRSRAQPGARMEASLWGSSDRRLTR